MKNDEKNLLLLALERGGKSSCLFRELSESKRFNYLAEKWTTKGYWECGVSLRTGWLTEEGVRKAIELTNP